MPDGLVGTIPPAPADVGGPYLTAAEVAALLHRSPAWVRRTVPGKLTLGHRTVLWRRVDVLGWLDRCAGSP